MQKVQKVAGWLGAVLGKMILAGLVFQTVIGILWMCGNLTGFQEFGESYLYQQAAQTLLCDEYTGILYPLFLKLVMGMAGVFAVPYPTIVYLLQLAAAGYGGYVFCKSLNPAGFRKNLLGMAFLMGAPAAMQCHLAVLPCSFVSSALLLEIAGLAELIRGSRKIAWAYTKIGILYLTGTLLLPEYLWFGAIPVVVAALIGGIRYRKQKACAGTGKDLGKGFAALLLCLAAVFLLGNLTRTQGSYGRAKRTPELMAVSRFAGSCLENTYGYWPEDLKECLSEEEIQRSCHYAADVWQVFGKAAQDRLGQERADEVFRWIAVVGSQVYPDKVRHDLVWDLAAYTFSPFFLQLQLQDRGCASYSGRNYDIMRSREPLLTKYYVNYGSWWFAAGMLLTGVWQLARLAAQAARQKDGQAQREEKQAQQKDGQAQREKKQARRKKKTLCDSRKLAVYFCCVATGGSMVLWYTMQGAGMMDYKNTMPVLLFWTMWMTDAALGAGQEESDRS